MACAARDRIPLDRVLFMPAPRPPHKEAGTAYETRVRMVELAIGGEPRLELSRMEEFRSGPSYTVELLEHCRRELGDDLYFIVGADSVSDLAGWREPERLLSLATLVVFPRTGYKSVVPVEGDAAVILFEAPVIDISSTELRARIAGGRPVDEHLPNALRKFILDNSLYS